MTAAEYAELRVDMEDCGAERPLYDLDLEIAADGRPPSPVRISRVPVGYIPVEGDTLLVRVDPGDPERIAIDWERFHEARMNEALAKMDSTGDSGRDSALAELAVQREDLERGIDSTPIRSCPPARS